MASEVDISNLALSRLGAKSIVSLTEDSTAARECSRLFSHCRDSELRAHPWNFARKRARLAASSEAPAFGFSTQYPLPSDFLRLLPTAQQDDLQIEDGMILTNRLSSTEVLDIIYIRQVTDPNDFDQSFTDLLVARLAMDLAEKITQSNSKIDIAQQRYILAQREARRNNAFERQPSEGRVDSWITSRL